MTEIKLLTSILSCKTSRDIIKLLMKNEMYNAQIASKLNLTKSSTLFHLKKLLKLGLVSRKSTSTYGCSQTFVYKLKPNFLSIITIEIEKEFK